MFNPNYEAYLNKLNKNQNKVSELSRIINQPYNEKNKKKKKELALYAFLRTTQKDNTNEPPATLDKSGPSRQTTKKLPDQSIS